MNLGIPDLSIVIVNYRTPELLDKCIASIIQFTKILNYEIIIVDNDSQDNSEKIIKLKYPNISWYNMPENAGTSRAYNAGIRISKGKYIVILNSDTELVENTFLVLLEKYKENEKKFKTGLLACKIIGYDNIVQYNSNIQFPSIKKYWYTNAFYLKFHKKTALKKYEESEQKDQRYRVEHESKWIGIAVGIFNADICMRENLFFDEDIFMYSDEVEWCYRLMKKGYQHYYTPSTYLLHLNSGSSAFSEWREGQVSISEWLYFLKTRGKAYYICGISLLYLKHFVDKVVFIKKKLFNNIEENDLQLKKYRRFEIKLLKGYACKILFNFKRKTSSSQVFLKYDIQKN